MSLNLCIGIKTPSSRQTRVEPGGNREVKCRAVTNKHHTIQSVVSVLHGFIRGMLKSEHVSYSAKNVTAYNSVINPFGFRSWASEPAPAQTCWLGNHHFSSHKTVTSIVVRNSMVGICCWLFHVNLRWCLQRWKQQRLSGGVLSSCYLYQCL